MLKHITEYLTPNEEQKRQSEINEQRRKDAARTERMRGYRNDYYSQMGYSDEDIEEMSR